MDSFCNVVRSSWLNILDSTVGPAALLPNMVFDFTEKLRTELCVACISGQGLHDEEDPPGRVNGPWEAPHRVTDRAINLGDEKAVRKQDEATWDHQ